MEGKTLNTTNKQPIAQLSITTEGQLIFEVLSKIIDPIQMSVALHDAANEIAKAEIRRQQEKNKSGIFTAQINPNSIKK